MQFKNRNFKPENKHANEIFIEIKEMKNRRK